MIKTYHFMATNGHKKNQCLNNFKLLFEICKQISPRETSLALIFVSTSVMFCYILYLLTLKGLLKNIKINFVISQKTIIFEHIINIYNSGELEESVTIRKIRKVQKEGVKVENL